MSTGSNRLVHELQQLELDWEDAKDSWRGKLKRGLSKLEKTVLQSGPMKGLLEVNSDEFREETERPLLGGKLAFLGLCQESDSDMGQGERKIIGMLHVRIKTMLAREIGKQPSKVYFTIQCEKENVKSPVAFQRKGGGDVVFTWELEVRFPVSDLTGCFTLKIYSVSLISPMDVHLGSLVVPFRSFFQKYTSAVYHMFPSHSGLPGYRMAQGSGLDKNEFRSDLEVSVTHELRLQGPDAKLVWPLYLCNRRFCDTAAAAAQEDKNKRIQTLSIPQELHKSMGQLKRNRARMEAAILQLLSSPPVRGLLLLRSWEHPGLTLFSVASLLFTSKWLETYHYPFVFFWIVAVVALQLRYEQGCDNDNTQNNNHDWVIWNEDIQDDPDMDLSIVQRLAKLIQIFNCVGKAMDVGACMLEKSANVLNSSDPEVTLVFFMLLFVACCAWAAALWAAQVLGLSLFGIIVAAIISVPVPKSSRIFNILLVLFDRIPSHDDLARKWMVDKQIIYKLD